MEPSRCVTSLTTLGGFDNLNEMGKTELVLIAKLHRRKAKIIKMGIEYEEIFYKCQRAETELNELKLRGFTTEPANEMKFLKLTKEFNDYKDKAEDKIQELLQRLKPFEAKQDEN